jgi:cobalt-zinc-cadmium efflux system membrane fusion protein
MNQLKIKFQYPVFLLAGVMLFLSCRHEKSESQAELPFCIPDSLVKNIILDTVHSESVSGNYLRLSGKITFTEDNVVKIFPLVGGHVVEVKVTLGDYVKKGQELARVRSSEMASFYNDYKAAQYDLSVAKKNLDVVSDLRSSGVSSEKDYLSAQSDYRKALAQYNKMSEILKIYGGSGQSLDSVGSGYAIKAPIEGFIVEKNVNAGQELRADDAANLFTISDLKEVWATANVYESDIAKIKVGDAAEITTLSYPDRKMTGKVERISNVLNPETNVMNVKVRLKNEDYALKPGMFANISILSSGQEKMLVVPTKSVVFDENKNYVVLYKNPCDVKIEKVNVFKTLGDKTYIQSDSLREGNAVIGRNGLFIFAALKNQ